jgi:regulator of cell morphogenesis and NO signaling
MNWNATKTVREFALEMPGAARIFERFGIDYCCGGSKPLHSACRQANVSLDEVLRCLEEASQPDPSLQTEVNIPNGTLAELIAHILTVHHAYVKTEVPRIKQLLWKVVAVHGSSHPELAAVQQAFHVLGEELVAHMMKEELILFPYIGTLEQARSHGKPAPRPAFGSISNPVRMMELEHESSGRALEAIRRLTTAYTPPESACFSYKTLYSALKDFEADLHQHVHLENNLLFPRSIALEGQR